MYIEEALEAVDESGIVQTMSIVLLSFFSALSGMQMSATNYVSGRLDHWCTVPELQNLDYDTQKKLAIPYDGKRYKSCEVYQLPWENFTWDDLSRWNGSHTDPSTPRESCNSWTYYRDDVDNTAVNKWNLVCPNSAVPELISSFFMLGMLVGSFLANIVSERLGRTLSALVFGFLLSAVTYAGAFTPEPISFAVLRFLMGVMVRASNLAVTVHAMELAGKGQRELAGVLLPSAIAVGTILCAFCGYFLRDFSYIILVMAVCQTALLPLYFILPQSPRWLMSRGRVDQAEKVIRWIGEVNRSPLPKDAVLEVKESEAAEDDSKNTMTFADLLRNSVIRRNMILMHYFVVASHFCYTTMTLNLGSLTGSIHLNVFLSGLLELPATISALIILKFVSRVKTVILFGLIFLLCNGLAIVFEIIPDLAIVASIFTIIARAAASGLMCAQRIILTELFPTAARQRMMGSVTGLSSILSLFGPFIGEPLRSVWTPLPNILFAILGVFSVLLSFCLPETSGIDLPDTLEEAAQLSRKIQKQKAQNGENGDIRKISKQSNEKLPDSIAPNGIELENYEKTNPAFVPNGDLAIENHAYVSTEDLPIQKF